MTLQSLLDEKKISYIDGESMSKRTTFGIGGPAFLIVPKDEEELREVLAACKETNQVPFILGHGSNLLVSDEGIQRPVISLEAFQKVQADGDEMTFGAGLMLIKACTFAEQTGLSGMEWAFGIPGSVGGAVYMNAGAYEGEMKNIVLGVHYMDPDGYVLYASGDEMDFSYRRSRFTDKNQIILDVTVKLQYDDREKIRERMDDYMTRRRTKQPLEYGSAGSTFKRPEGNYASALIDQCGLKGLAVGDAQVSEKHAGFIVNRGHATAKDVMTLVDSVQTIVEEETGTRLECEMIFVR